MKPIGMHNYYVYILTNSLKTVLYIGVTNNLYRRLREHYQDSKTKKKTFAGKYNCYNLIYYEYFQFINHAIDREKELKGWRRSKKVELVENVNPDWKFLNDEIE
jgi:putative endonuclease